MPLELCVYSHVHLLATKKRCILLLFTAYASFKNLFTFYFFNHPPIHAVLLFHVILEAQSILLHLWDLQFLAVCPKASELLNYWSSFRFIVQFKMLLLSLVSIHKIFDSLRDFFAYRICQHASVVPHF